jgi:hypothetical protein
MHASTETIECPLCLGVGSLKRSEVLDRLGVKDLARVAQLSAEEVFRLVQRKNSGESQQVWARFESELTRRAAEIELRHRGELQALTVQNGTLTHRLEDYLREVAQLREQNQGLETEMAKVSRIGKREEMDFADEARTWPGVSLEGISRNGDFILNYRDPSGAVIPPRILIDNKNKTVLAESDISKLVRDAKERNSPVAVLVAKDESQLRQLDRECRWGQKDGIWVLRTTRRWLPRDLDVLRPLLERMGSHDVDFLNRDVALADKVRRSLIDLDEVEKELKKATKAIMSASGLVISYRSRLKELCESAVGRKMPTGCELSTARIGQ